MGLTRIIRDKFRISFTLTLRKNRVLNHKVTVLLSSNSLKRSTFFFLLPFTQVDSKDVRLGPRDSMAAFQFLPFLYSCSIHPTPLTISTLSYASCIRVG